MRLRQLSVFLVIAWTSSFPLSSSATDWYWINDFGGNWDDNFSGFTNWKDPLDTSGIPNLDDNAFLVLPYSLAFCPAGESWADGNCITQPVPVQYRSATDPNLNQLVIESQNLLHQRASTPDGLLDLTSNTEIIGGSGIAFTPPPSYFLPPDSPGIFPLGRHVQEAGMNTVNSLLMLGGSAGSSGSYELSGSGTLQVGNLEKIGAGGSGEFLQLGGSHSVANILILGESSSGTGTYELTGGDLDVGDQEIIGSSGLGVFTQSAGVHNAGIMVLGSLERGTGSYTLTEGTLDVDRSVSVGREGTGFFTQEDGTATFGSLILASQGTGPGDRGNGTYILDGGILNVTGKTQVGRDGLGLFFQDGGHHLTHGLEISGNASGDGTYQLLDGTLEVVGNEIIDGAAGSGFTSSFEQTGGEHIVRGEGLVSGRLILGQDRAGATYTLSQADSSQPTTLETDILVIGNTQSASFTQQGSVFNAFVTVNNELSIAEFADSDNSFYQMTDGKLEVFGQAVVGKRAFGEIRQDGGAVVLRDDFVIGAATVGDGLYTMTEGTLEVFGKETIGDQGHGRFEQTGGTHHAFGNLFMAETDNGTSSGYDAEYVLGSSASLGSSGSLQVDGVTVVGRAGVARFEHTGPASHVVGDDLVVGSLDTSDGTYIMRTDFPTLDSEHPTLDIGDDLIIGQVTGATAEFILEAGTLTVGGDTLVVAKSTGSGSEYTFSQSGGEHNADRLIITTDVSGTPAIGPHPSYLLSDGTLSVTNAIVGEGGTGTFHQTGGSFDVGLLTVGTDRLIGPQGQFADYLFEGGELDIGTLIIGSPLANCNLGCGSLFSQDGGTVKALHSVRIGADGERDGYYSMTRGEHGNLEVGDFGHTGSIIVGGSSSESRIAGSLHIGDRNTVLVHGGTGENIFVHHNGRVFIGGGTLSATSTVEVPRASRASPMTLLASNPAVENIVNEGVIEFSGAPTGQINGGLLNRGTIEVSATTARIDDRLINFGELKTSGGATTLLEDLIVETSGWLDADAGDRFIVSGNFENRSQQNSFWDTDLASLILDSGGTQDMALAGMDMGATVGGYSDNFSWGELRIGSGTTLNLLDGNDTAGAALYVGLFDLVDGVDTGTLMIASIMSDFNIYYDSRLAGNDYLGGLSFALNGAGTLTPYDLEVIPVPPAVYLFASGIAGLFAAAKRKKHAQARQPHHACKDEA